jgi:hypothetical protein
MNESMCDAKRVKPECNAAQGVAAQGFREHGIAVAIRSAQQKNALPPGSKHHGAYGEKSRPAANERFASMAGEANVRCEAVAGSIKRTSN